MWDKPQLASDLYAIELHVNHRTNTVEKNVQRCCMWASELLWAIAMRQTEGLTLVLSVLLSNSVLSACEPAPVAAGSSIGGSPGGSAGPEPGAGGASPAGGRAGSGGDTSAGGLLVGGEGGEFPGTGGDSVGPVPRWLAVPVTGGDTRPLVLLRSDGNVEPITIAENISSFSSPAWSSDGARLIYVDYFCCGFSNAAYEVSVAGLAVGEPVPIHAPLTGGETIRYATYAPGSDAILAGFVDSEISLRWSMRRQEEAASEWVHLDVPVRPWDPSALEPAWAPDGTAVLLIGGEPVLGERLYRVGVTEGFGQAVEVLALAPGKRFTGLAWSPDSRLFAAASETGIHLGDVGGPAMILVSGDPEEGMELGQAGASNQSSSEFGPHFPFEFSEDSRSLIYGAYSGGPATGTMRLFRIALAEAGAAEDYTKTVLFEAPNGSEARFWGPVVSRGRQLFLPAALLSSPSAEIYQIDIDSGKKEARAPIPEGQTYQGFAWVPAGLLYLTADSSYVPNRLFFEPHGSSRVTPLEAFQFEEGAVPAWSGFLGPQSPEAGGFFFANELDPDSGYPAGARLWHYDGDGELALVSEASEQSPCAFTDPGAYDGTGEQFALACDLDGDQFGNILVTTKLAGEFGEPVDVGSLFDVYGGTPAEFVWQP